LGWEKTVPSTIFLDTQGKYRRQNSGAGTPRKDAGAPWTAVRRAGRAGKGGQPANTAEDSATIHGAVNGQVAGGMVPFRMELLEGNMPPTFGNGKICYIEMPATDIGRSAELPAGSSDGNVRQRGDGSTAFDE